MAELFTVFTPTYNRAHTLPRVYESLVAQNFSDFEWLIVDDGSTDGTQKLVESFRAENKIKIRSIFQENAGKHIAINTALKNAHGEWFITVDSDDYLREEALFKIKEISKSLSSEFAGFTGIHFSDKIDFDTNLFGTKTWTGINPYDGPHHGEMSFIWRTEIAKKFPFPVFEGEKFCQESLVLRRIIAKHRVLFTDHVLFGGDYLEGGLTDTMWKNLRNSPRYSMLNYAERMKIPKLSKKEIQGFADHYWEIALSAKHIPWSEKLSGIPFCNTLKYFTRKLGARSFRR